MTDKYKESSASSRYYGLQSDRESFLEMGRKCARLTLPYLLTDEGQGEELHTPWQSVGSKGCNVLSSKLMLSLFPINTNFFKLQVNDAELSSIEGVDANVRSEIDLSLSKMETIIKEQIAETNDRVQLHSALKQLVVTGNVLLFAGKKALKVFPLDRFCIVRDGDGTPVEMITKEIVDRSFLPKEFQTSGLTPYHDANSPGEDGPKIGVASNSNKGQTDDAVVFTYVKLEDGHHKWCQECDGEIIPGSKSSSPVKTSPWMPLRFNVVDGESYGRGRVEEFIGDLTSLEQLTKAMVEGSSAAARVVFMVSPSATTKPQSLAKAATGSIIQGRQDDVSVVQVGKTADFKTVQEMIGQITGRLADAFLVLQVRDSERTTSTEVNATVQELNEQLGGIYGNLTSELLKPYLNRKLSILTKSKKVPPLPKGLVMPIVVAGLSGIGRGQDKQALMEFVSLLGNSMGPEAMMAYVKVPEFIKRLAAAQGIEAIGLVKTEQELEQEKQQAQQQQAQASIVSQVGQLSKSPIAEQMINGQQQNPEEASTPQASPQG